MYCSNCGVNLADKSNFCIHCGAKVHFNKSTDSKDDSAQNIPTNDASKNKYPAQISAPDENEDSTEIGNSIDKSDDNSNHNTDKRSIVRNAVDEDSEDNDEDDEDEDSEDNDDDDEDDEDDNDGNKVKSNRKNKLGEAALVIGISSVLLMFIPFVGVIACIIGGILALVAMESKSCKTMAIFGLIFCIIFGICGYYFSTNPQKNPFWGQTTVYELAKVIKMSKLEIVDKFGKPGKIINETNDGFSYSYSGGFSVCGAGKKIQLVTLRSGDITNKSDSELYKMGDTKLGDSFDQTIARLGKPQLSGTGDGFKSAIYLVENDYYMEISTEKGTDKINDLTLALLSLGLRDFNVGTMSGKMGTEKDLRQLFEVTQVRPNTLGIKYTIYSGLEFLVDDQTNIISSVSLTERNIYNIFGLRIGDSFDDVKNLFGNAIDTTDLDETRMHYQYTQQTKSGEKYMIGVNVDKMSKKVNYIVAYKQ